MVFRNHLYKRMLFMVCALLLVWIPYAPGAQAAAADRLVSSPPASLGLGGGVRDYQPTSDGGYVAAGGSSVTKLDGSENMQWSASISPPENVRILAVRELPMGGYIFAGEKTGRFMYGTLKANGTLNHMTLSPHPIGEATSIVKVGNDGFVIAGHVRTNLGDPLDPFLMRTDVSGVLLGEKVISIPGDQRVDSAIAAAGTDTDVILAGSTSENASHEGYMAEVTGSADNFGSVVWAKNYGADSTSYYSLSSVDYAKDEAGQPGYVATGNVVKRSGVQNALLLFTELDGKEKWLQTYQASPQLGLDVAQAKDGGFAIAGGNNNTAGFLYKTDANGNLQWQKEWPNTGNLLDVMPMDDGIYQLAGGISDGITFQTWVGPPAGLVADDDANRIIGLDESMEYSTDGGNRYEAYTGQDPVFDGEVSVLVRYKADPAGGYEAGKTATFIFTANPSQPGLPPGYTYSQDGFGFSGAVEAEPLGDRIVMTGYNDWPSDFSKQDYAFAGGVFDGQNIWMVPAKADRVIKLDTANGRMTGYDDWPSDFSLDSGQSLGAFRGGVYDGESIWMIPYDADQLIKLDKHTGEMTGYHSWPAGFSKQSHAFSGGVDDGKNIWMIPQNADRVIKVDKSTGSMTGFNAWPAGFTKSYAAFSGGVYDGRNIWMIPVLADRVIKLDTVTGEMTGYDQWPDGFAKSSNTTFGGGAYDGENIWLIPYGSDQLIKLDAGTGQMTGYPIVAPQNSSAFASGIYDGESIWMIPYHSDKVVRVDKATGDMTEYNNWPSGFSKGWTAFFGSVYDGESIWMIPYFADRVVKLSAAPLTYSLTYDGNGATSGAAPSDSAQYQSGDVVTVSGNTGGLEKTGYTFSGWNTAADGSGTDYAPGASYTITGNATLYAKWTKQNSDADLRSLALSDGVLTPSFSADTLQYSANVSNRISSVTVTVATEEDASTATVSVYDSVGQLVQGPLHLTNGEASDPLSLHVGRNTLIVTVTAQDGTEKAYTVSVTRARANQPPPPTQPPTQPPYYPVTDISLDETELTFTEGDEEVELKAAIVPSYATNQQVTWSSSDPEVATVDQDGTVTPKAPGTAVITVTTADGNKTASCKVTVEAKERPFKIETSDKEILVGPNRMVSFRSFVVYPNGKRKEITWSRDPEYSSSSSLLTVKNGRIKAGKKEGEAFVTISYQGEERKIPVQITKTLVKSLSVPSKTVKLKKGEGQQLELTANLTDKQTKDVTERAVWTSSNEKIAKVSDTGEVTAIGVGSTWIRANYGGSQLSVRLIVTKDKPDLKKLTASSRTLRIGEGDSEQVTLTAVFEDGSEKDVTTDADWTSDDSRIAEVAEGTITGITAGSTTVTASYEKKKVTVKVTVLAAKTTE